MSKFITIIKGIVSNLLVSILNYFPVKKNKIFIFSYYGSQYGCSPKYISEYLVENYPKDKFDVVWAFNDIESKKDIKGIRKIRTMSLKYFYELCTSKVIITNFRTTDLFKKRKNQYYIQTWHSSLRLKQIEKDAEKFLPENYLEMAKKDSPKCDLLLSGCKFSTEIFERAFWYSGKIFEHGTPRNDIFFAENRLRIKEIKRKLNIFEYKKIILYAPTFRKEDGLEVYNVDYDKVINELKNKFNGEWIFLVKLHPHLVSKSKELVYGKNVKDVTGHDDIQELLAIADILISDYSSLMFDFALTERPCFLYVPDIEGYTNNDRKLYFDINELPFIKTLSNESLINEIKQFNSSEYINNLKLFSSKVGTFESGEASKKLAKHIEAICFEYMGENRMKKYKVGYTTGVFDMFHIGHLNILKRAKEQCDYLIVGVSTDELVKEYKNKVPIIPFDERADIVQAIDYVDKVIPQINRDKFWAWKQIEFNVMFVGDDWKGNDLFKEVEFEFKKVGVDVVYFEYTKDTSSTILRDKLNAM